jgi:translation initiation factor 1A
MMILGTVMARKKKKKSYGSGVIRALTKADVNGQVYGYIDKALGSGFFNVMCVDNKARRSKLRGSMRKRCRLTAGDYVLVALREFDESTSDIIHKYTIQEVRILQKEKEIPTNTGGDGNNNEEGGFIFGEEEEEKFAFEDI